MSKILTVCISKKKGTAKKPVVEIKLLPNHGVEGDAHAGDWHRQVSLLAQESHEKMLRKGAEVTHGDFGENIVTEGIILSDLIIGTTLRLGSFVTAEVTQIGKECHNHCAIFARIGDCIMPREGIFVKILTGGTVKPGDDIRIVGPPVG